MLSRSKLNCCKLCFVRWNGVVSICAAWHLLLAALSILAVLSPSLISATTIIIVMTIAIMTSMIVTVTITITL